MGKFEDTLNSFGVSLELPDEFKTAITSAYEEDFYGAVDKENQLNTQISEKDAELARVKREHDEQLSAAKAANWDLLRSGGNALGKSNSNTDSDDEDDDSNEDITIDDLFKPHK